MSSFIIQKRIYKIDRLLLHMLFPGRIVLRVRVNRFFFLMGLEWTKIIIGKRIGSSWRATEFQSFKVPNILSLHPRNVILKFHTKSTVSIHSVSTLRSVYGWKWNPCYQLKNFFVYQVFLPIVTYIHYTWFIKYCSFISLNTISKLIFTILAMHKCILGVKNKIETNLRI